MKGASAAIILGAAALVRAAPAAADPCSVAAGTYWVSSSQAHACELNVPFNQTKSLDVITSAIKALQYYSTETWFIHSPNPKIPHDYDIRLQLNTIKNAVAAGGYKTDWDFNLAISDAFNREWDGHTVFTANCFAGFSWNLPFSIATLASDVSDTQTAYPTLVTNYDFPLQGRPGLEAYYQALGFNARKYDGFRVLAIEGVAASNYLVQLAQDSATRDGLAGSYESLQPRYMRLMTRYSADTPSGQFTQEVGRFGMRAYYPGTDAVTMTLQNNNGKNVTITVPWSAHFVGTGNTTSSFISSFCNVAQSAVAVSNNVALPQGDTFGGASPAARRALGTVDPDSSAAMREIAEVFAKVNASTNYVKPNLVSYGPKVPTIDIYRLKKNPKVGVVYMEQFSPSTGISANAYFNGVSDALFQGLSQLKAQGVENIIIDQSGNRGGYIFAGAIAMWSFFPQDLYPGFPAVFRDLDLANKESKRAANQQNYNSEYFYANYRDLDYNILTSNKQFMNPQVNVTINGVSDAYSQQFFDDFGPGSSSVTNFTTPPFEGSNIVFVANSICASTCSVFSNYLWQKHGVRSAVFGGLPTQKLEDAQFDGGVKGSEVTSYSSVLGELRLAGLDQDPAAPKPLPIKATFNMNFRNAIPYVNKEDDDIMEFTFNPATTHYQFTKKMYNNPQAVWEFVAGQYFDAAPLRNLTDAAEAAVAP